MHDDHPQRAPDYTNAALVMLFVNLLWIFLLVLALFGLWAVMALGYVLNLVISWLANYKARSSAGADRA